MTTANPAEDRRFPSNQQILDAVQGVLSSHVTEKHLDLSQAEIQEMVEEHRELYDEVAPLARDTNAKVTLLVDEMYGQVHPTAADPEHREGGLVALLTELRDEVHNAQITGVKVERKWSTAQWTFFGTIGAAFITTCGAVILALLGGG